MNQFGISAEDNNLNALTFSLHKQVSAEKVVVFQIHKKGTKTILEPISAIVEALTIFQPSLKDKFFFDESQKSLLLASVMYAESFIVNVDNESLHNFCLMDSAKECNSKCKRGSSCPLVGDIPLNKMIFPIVIGGFQLGVVFCGRKSEPFTYKELYKIKESSIGLYHYFLMHTKNQTQIETFPSEELSLKFGHKKNLTLFAGVALTEAFLIAQRISSVYAGLEMLSLESEDFYLDKAIYFEERKNFYAVISQKNDRINESLDIIKKEIDKLKEYGVGELQSISLDIQREHSFSISKEQMEIHEEFCKHVAPLLPEDEGLRIKKIVLSNENIRKFRHQIINHFTLISLFILHDNLKDEIKEGIALMSKSEIRESLLSSIRRLECFKESVHCIAKMSEDYSNFKKIFSDISYFRDFFQRTERNIKQFIYLDQKIDIDFCYILKASQKFYFSPEGIEDILKVLINNACEELGEKRIRCNDESMGFIKVEILVENKQLIIAVEDSGRGIPSAFKTKLFESYGTFGKPGGTGMGLALASKITKSFGGKIEYLPLEEGSCFMVTLPIKMGVGDRK